MRVLIVSAGLLALAAVGGGEAAGAAEELRATMRKVDATGVGEEIGTVRATRAEGGGVMLGVDLRGLPPGERGFHVHQNGDCGPGPNAQGQVVAAGAAGGHWDPQGTKAHAGPEGQGHLGDLPFLRVDADGTAKAATLATRIRDLGELRGKALMIHAGGDNYADQPEPLGGGGGRIACGVFE
jgi:superoxide dismutase, Cu-Zn family